MVEKDSRNRTSKMVIENLGTY